MKKSVSFINDYIHLKSLLNRSFLAELIVANMELNLENYCQARKSIKRAMDVFEQSDDSFPMLLEVAIFANAFELLEKCKLLDVESLRKSEDILNRAFVVFYDLKNNIKNECDLLEVLALCNSDEEKSVIFYLISKFADGEMKIFFLKQSVKNNKSNLSALKDLYILGEEIGEIELKNLYLSDLELFYKKHFDKTHIDDDFKFAAIGGGNSIGGSSYLISFKDCNFLIDAGIGLSQNEKVFPSFDKFENEIKSCDACIITHAHLDHCGAIVEAYKINNNMKFLMTKETKELIKLNIKKTELGLEDCYLLDSILSKSLLINFNEPFNWKGKDLRIEFFRAGHILGAAALYFKTSNLKVFFTGDFSLENQKTVDGLRMPKEKIDIFITENTYGNRRIDEVISSKLSYLLLEKYVVDAIESGKKVLIPAFAIGRSQEIIHYLKDVAKEHDFRLYVDGDSVKVSELYIKNNKNLEGRNVHFIKNMFYDSKSDFIKEEFLTNRSCVVCSSGMLKEGSCSCEYLKELVESENALCILTGYQATGTIGADIKNQIKMDGHKYLKIGDESYKINCSLQSLGLSAHSGVDAILAIITKLKASKVVLIHGEGTQEGTYIKKLLDAHKDIDVYQSENNRFVKF